MLPQEMLPTIPPQRQSIVNELTLTNLKKPTFAAETHVTLPRKTSMSITSESPSTGRLPMADHDHRVSMAARWNLAAVAMLHANPEDRGRDKQHRSDWRSRTPRSEARKTA
jgi:hypothetical protein